MRPDQCCRASGVPLQARAGLATHQARDPLRWGRESPAPRPKRPPHAVRCGVWEAHLRSGGPSRCHHGHHRVVLVADKRSLQCLKTGDVVVPPVKGARARFLWVPKWAFRVSRAAACVMVPGSIPETSMATWQDACDPTRAGVAGAGAMCADDHGVGATKAGLYQGAGCGARGRGRGCWPGHRV